MITKKIMICLMAFCFITIFSSVNVNAGTVPTAKTSKPLTIVTLYNSYVVSGVTYLVYVYYDTATGLVTGADVYLTDCTPCGVISVTTSPSFFVVKKTSHSYQISGSITVTTSCNTFTMTGLVTDAAPYC